MALTSSQNQNRDTNTDVNSGNVTQYGVGRYTIGEPNKSHHFTGNPTRSMGAKLVTTWLLLSWLTWFCVEISIASISTDPSIRGWRTLLASSFTQYGIQGLIMLGSLLALWYSETCRTRNTQLMAFVISTAVVFTWFLDFAYIRHNLSNGDIRGFCDNTIGNGATPAAGATFFGTGSQLCRLSRAVAILSILMEAGQFALHLYCLGRLLVPLTNPTITQEQIQTTEATQLSTNSAKAASVNLLNKSIIAFTILSLIGYIIMACSWIKLQQWQYPIDWIGPVGDPVIASMGYQLTTLWCVTWASSILAGGRHSRGTTALSWFLTTLSALSLWSFFIFSSRRPQQYSILTEVAYLSAERGVVAGLGIMLCCESIRWAILFARYYTYIPVTLTAQPIGTNGLALSSSYWPSAGIKSTNANGPNDGTLMNYPTTGNDELSTGTKDLPAPYTMPVFANASTFLKVIIGFQSLVSLGWFLTQLVLECRRGLFNDIAATFAPERPFPALYMDPERSFLYHLMIVGAAISACYFSERIPLHCTAVAAATLLPILGSTWWLLLWPTLYDMVYDRGVSQSIVLSSGIEIGYSKGGKAVSIFGFLTLLSLCSMFFYAITRAASRTTLVTRRVLQLFVSLTIIGTLIWSLSAIKRNISFLGYASPYTPNLTNDGFLYLFAFFIMTTVALSTWINSLISTSYLGYSSRGWKEASWLSTWVTFTFMLPVFIVACRWINFDDWNNSVPTLALPEINNTINSSADLAICAGLIILGCGIFMEMLDATLLVSTPRTSRKQNISAKNGINNETTIENRNGTFEKDLEAGVPVPGQMASSNMVKDVKNPGNQNYIVTNNMSSTTVSPHAYQNGYDDYNHEVGERRNSEAVAPVDFRTAGNNVVV